MTDAEVEMMVWSYNISEEDYGALVAAAEAAHPTPSIGQGLPIEQWLRRRRAPAAAPAPAKKPVVPAIRNNMALAPPAGGAHGIPTAADYRVTVHDIRADLCMGRRFAYEDVRWAPHVLAETQCKNAPADGDDLCPTCRRRLDKYAEKPKPGPWTGRINEEPEGWLHMLGTAWAEFKQPKWVGPK
jgi:hypothetical protein